VYMKVILRIIVCSKKEDRPIFHRQVLFGCYVLYFPNQNQNAESNFFHKAGSQSVRIEQLGHSFFIIKNI